MKGRLRNKIFFLMLLVSVVPILIAGFLSFWSIRASHRIDVANLEDALLVQRAAQIKGFISDAVGNLQLTVDYRQTVHIATSGERFIISGILKANSAFEELSFIDLDGQETSRFNRAFPDGVDPAELRDQSRIEKFQVAKTGKSYLGPVYYTLKGPMMTVAAPVKNKDGIVISVFTGEVNLKPVAQIIQEAELGTTGYLSLVDQDGSIIGSGLHDFAKSGNSQSLGIIKEVLAGKDFLGPEAQQRYNNVFGDPVVAGAEFLPDYHWGIVAEWPVREADAVVNQMLYRNILVSLLVALAVIGVSILLATLIVKPIKKLESGTEFVAQGKFDQPITIETGDELEELGTSFNKMMAGLKELEQLKDEFVFIAAHELRTPVAAMKGYLQLILEGMTGPIPDKTKDFIQKVVNSNQRLIQLVNDLLEVSRSQAGKLMIKVVPIDVVEPIRGVLDELKSLADKSSVTLAYEPQPGLPKVMGDADRLKEVVINLVGNSIKYMGGAGSVTISHEVKDGMLLTHVKDTGLGISKSAQAKLFEKFYRVQTEKTQEIQGTGLGLFIVKEIIEKMGGTIAVDSEEGKGSDFYFSLPLAAGE